MNEITVLACDKGRDDSFLGEVNEERRGLSIKLVIDDLSIKFQEVLRNFEQI